MGQTRVFGWVLALAICTPLTAWGVEIQADSRLTAVTVFPGSAEVTRTATVRLPAGSSTVVVPEMVPFPEDTLQATGDGAVAVTIVSVEVARRFLAQVADGEERALRDRIQALEDDKRAGIDRVNALRAQVDFIRNVISTSPPSVKEGMLRDDPAKWRTAWSAIGDGMGQALAGIQKEEVARRATNAEIERLRNELNRIATGRKMVFDVRVQVTAAKAGEFHLSLKHTVSGATWTPRYDLRLEPDAGRVAITQQAEVRNRTGEAWEGVTLRLSTTRPAQGVAMPEPAPWFIDFPQLPVVMGRARGFAGSPAAFEEAEMELRVSKNDAFADEVPAAPVLAERVAAVAEVAEFTAEYAIDGRQTLPADNEPHTFTVAEHAAAASLLVRTWPATRAAAYLYARLTYGGEIPLPAGPATVFRDGVMVGRYPMPEIRPGETIKLPFGVDDRVVVTHQVDSDLTGKGGIIGKRREVARGFRIGVENFHTQPIDVTVYDRLPVAKNEDIRVRPIRENTPDTPQGDDAIPGVLAWERVIPPGEKHDIRFGYEVSFPKDRQVPGF
ncbi:MAG: mucoidy inhibitor MuiA family protein [Nitrospirota bacterium]|nr:mucoidy inhibitor MuiA family protein [Nitrospirota bacterium]